MRYWHHDLNLFVGDFTQAKHHDTLKPDLAWFSPPYKTKDGYSEELMERLGAFLQSLLADDATIVMNFGQLKEDFDRPHKALSALVAGSRNTFRIGQTIIWVKSIVMDRKQVGHYQPINSDHLLNYCWEYLFVLHRGNQKPLDRLSVGVPFTDKGNLTRGDRGKNGDLHCAGDVWFIPYKTTGNKDKKKHAYEYPEELADRVLKLFRPKCMFDPFLGSGTSIVAARKLGISAIGSDLVEGNVDVAFARWTNAVKPKTLLEERRESALAAEARAQAQPDWKQGSIVFSDGPIQESLPDYKLGEES